MIEFDKISWILSVGFIDALCVTGILVSSKLPTRFTSYSFVFLGLMTLIILSLLTELYAFSRSIFVVFVHLVSCVYNLAWESNILLRSVDLPSLDSSFICTEPKYDNNL